MQNINSIHLQKIPSIYDIPLDVDILSTMSFVRKVCNSALSIRKKNNIKARIPLASVLIAGYCDTMNNMFMDVIKDEINVKAINFTDDLSTLNIKKIVHLDAARVAKRLGKDFQVTLQKAKSGEFIQTGSDIEINGHRISESEYEIQLSIEGNDTNYTSIDGQYLVILDINITDDLQNEGIARDFIRAIQSARKDAGLNIADYITIDISSASDEINNALQANLEYIRSQVLGRQIIFHSITEITEGYIAFAENVYFKVQK